jgi:adenylate cyclase class 2
MAEEIEAKVKVADPEALRRRLAARGLAAVGPVLEVNRLFDDDAGSLRGSGAALRLREERPAEGGAVIRTLLTYKGPRAPSRMKRRPEFETQIASSEQMVRIITELGLSEVFLYEKRRTTWHVGECEVTLDEVPHLGWFVEVEGPAEETILAALADIGLAGEPILTKSYIGLLREHLAAKGLDTRRAVFPSSTY